MKFSLPLLVLSAVSFFSSQVSIAAPKLPKKLPFKVYRTVLPNGVTALLVPRKDLPILSFQTWFRVGSSSENQPSQFGLAHLFEHLMFSGTQNYPKNTYDLYIESNGGNNNAFTSRDYTQYHVNIRSDQIDLVLDLESDRIQNFLVALPTLSKEKKIVLEERKETVQDSLNALIYQKAWELVYKGTSYAHPIIGTQKSIENFELHQVSNWHQNNYFGKNILLTIVGDINLKTLIPKLKKKYRKIKKGKIPSKPKSIDSTQSGQRALIPWPTRNFSLFIAYPTVRANHKDTYPLDVLSNLIHESKASRLYKKFIIKRNIANFTQGSHISTLQNGMFYSFISLRPGVRVESGALLYRQIIENLRSKGVLKKELERIRTNMLLEFDHNLHSVENIGTMLSLNELLMGTYKRWLGDLKLYANVTKKDVLRVLNKYIRPEKAAVVISHPKGFKPPVEIEGFPK